jgi:hypothetical protein
MAGLLVFAPWVEGDAALWNSHWIAQETARAALVPVTVLERDAAVREHLEAALTREQVDGIALFGHGLRHAVVGADGREALDVGNLHLVGRHRWVHAIACNVGLELVPAAAAHVDLFVGYDIKLNVSWPWPPRDLPPELRYLLAQMVTATTLALLDGVRTPTELKRRAAMAVEDVVTWLAINAEEGFYAIHHLADQLVEHLVVSR